MRNLNWWDLAVFLACLGAVLFGNWQGRKNERKRIMRVLNALIESRQATSDVRAAMELPGLTLARRLVG